MDPIDGEIMSDKRLATVSPSTGTHALAMMSDTEFEANLAAVKKGQERIKRMQEALLVKGVDYANIPNVDKPSLGKPGAEKFTQAYNCTAEVTRTLIIGDNVTTPEITYDAQCDIHLGDFDGPVIGNGFGTCNSWETKYRYRDAMHVCPDCGKDLRHSKPPKTGWYCWTKMGGCGKEFRDDDSRITTQVVGRIENPDPWDLANTLMKMCLADTTPVLVRREGWISLTAMGDLVPGDEVPAPGGRWVFVEDVRRERMGAYSLVTASGSVVVASGSHRFPTERGLIEVKEIVPGDILTRSVLPDGQEDVGEDIAWAAGLFIADGSDNGRRGLTYVLNDTTKADAVNRLLAVASRLGASAKVKKRSDAHTVDVYLGRDASPAIRELIAGEKSSGRRFSDYAWNLSAGELEAMVRGYLAGDGSRVSRRSGIKTGARGAYATAHHVLPERYSVTFMRANVGLRTDLFAACARLGWRMVLRPGSSNFNDTPFPTWKGSLTIGEPFIHPLSLGKIVSVTPHPEVDTTDISVASKTRLFVLADGTVTHNSEKRAHCDAVLRAFAASGIFTQDLEDNVGIIDVLSPVAPTVSSGAREATPTSAPVVNNAAMEAFLNGDPGPVSDAEMVARVDGPQDAPLCPNGHGPMSVSNFGGFYCRTCKAKAR
jgi:hypothetical protein